MEKLKEFIKNYKHGIVHAVYIFVIIILIISLNSFIGKNNELFKTIDSEEERANELATQITDLQEGYDKLENDYDSEIKQHEALKIEFEPFLRLNEEERTLIKEEAIKLEAERIAKEEEAKRKEEEAKAKAEEEAAKQKAEEEEKCKEEEALAIEKELKYIARFDEKLTYLGNANGLYSYLNSFNIYIPNIVEIGSDNLTVQFLIEDKGEFKNSTFEEEIIFNIGNDLIDEYEYESLTVEKVHSTNLNYLEHVKRESEKEDELLVTMTLPKFDTEYIIFELLCTDPDGEFQTIGYQINKDGSVTSRSTGNATFADIQGGYRK